MGVLKGGNHLDLCRIGSIKRLCWKEIVELTVKPQKFEIRFFEILANSE